MDYKALTSFVYGLYYKQESHFKYVDSFSGVINENATLLDRLWTGSRTSR